MQEPPKTVFVLLLLADTSSHGVQKSVGGVYPTLEDADEAGKRWKLSQDEGEDVSWRSVEAFLGADLFTAKRIVCRFDNDGHMLSSEVEDGYEAQVRVERVGVPLVSFEVYVPLVSGANASSVLEATGSAFKHAAEVVESDQRYRAVTSKPKRSAASKVNLRV